MHSHHACNANVSQHVTVAGGGKRKYLVPYRWGGTIFSGMLLSLLLLSPASASDMSRHSLSLSDVYCMSATAPSRWVPCGEVGREALSVVARCVPLEVALEAWRYALSRMEDSSLGINATTLECNPCRCPTDRMAACYEFQAERERRKEAAYKDARAVFERAQQGGICRE